ncbi:MAG: hypothetical protein H7X95_10085 [Deltaproteobacteria bacterium]|nr:hypothetical protein [Deltaproteobacteria bacterium]
MRAPRVLLAVDGIDGSGKSVLARRLADAAAAAGICTVTLAVDDFRRPVDWGAGGETDIYYDDYYDLSLLDRCLRAFIDGGVSVEIPVFDAASHRLEGHREITFGQANLGIVEGVFARRIGAVADTAAVVYLRTSFAEAQRRVVARDTARGRALTDVNHRIAARYFPAQERYLQEFRPEARADVVIDNEDWRAPQIVRFDGDAIDSKLRLLAATSLPSSPGGSPSSVSSVLRRAFETLADQAR